MDICYLIEILLPITDRMRRELDAVRSELTDRFGGVTLHANAPAEGLWDDGESIETDQIVVVEVMADDLDRHWWIGYREALEARLGQDEIVVRATRIERL
jgi:hypothetical protein